MQGEVKKWWPARLHLNFYKESIATQGLRVPGRGKKVVCGRRLQLNFYKEVVYCNSLGVHVKVGLETNFRVGRVEVGIKG